MKKPETIDEYIAAYPPPVQLLLEHLRETIHSAAPNAEETISYGNISDFTLHHPALKLSKRILSTTNGRKEPFSFQLTNPFL
jgi:uncharacterized protein YdhG (YjbR/CyaY superfamily)